MSCTSLTHRTSLIVRGFASALFLFSVGLFLHVPDAYGQKDFEEWRKEQQQEYEQYLNEQDEAFLKFLKKQWRDVDVEAELGSPIDDKPEDIPTIGEMEPGASDPAATSNPPQPPPEPEPSPSEAEEETDPVADSEPPPTEAEEESDPVADSEPPPTEVEEESDPVADSESPPTEPEEEQTDDPTSASDPAPSDQRPSQVEANANMSQGALSFFGVQTTVPYTSALVPTVDGAPGKESIGDFWGALASEEYTPTLDALQQRREDLGLSDWGYYVYVRDLGDQLYQQKGLRAGSNDATLWTWFMMIKSGYSVRVGYRDDNIFLMLPVDGQIFNRPQLQLDGQRYYLMVEGGSGSLRTYEGQHETADQVLALDEAVLPKLGTSTKSRSASFSYDDERYTIDFKYNTAVLEYLRAYPNVELSVLFRSGVSSAAETSLKNALQSHVQDRPSRDALNFLLRFVQFSTKYQRDRENFGEERFLFPEESLAASASDCEDRAVLFAYLVRTLLDREVVGLQWPGHVATAVKVGEGLEAASEDRTFSVDGQTYILADPTYIGSSIGMEMPFVEDKEAEIISF